MSLSFKNGLAAVADFLNLNSILTLLDLSNLPEFAAVGLTALMGLGAGVLQVVLAMILVDLIGGILHWWEDTYADPEWPIIGPAVAKPNLEHHVRPRAFTKDTFWKRNRVIIPIVVALAVPIFLVFGFNIFTLSLLIAGMFAGEVHVWAHRTPKENGPVINALQRYGLVQNFRHHLNHHSGEKDSHYCVVTPWVNPVLERMDFWSRLTGFLDKKMGFKPREEGIADLHAQAAETKAGVSKIAA